MRPRSIFFPLAPDRQPQFKYPDRPAQAVFQPSRTSGVQRASFRIYIAGKDSQRSYLCLSSRFTKALGAAMNWATAPRASAWRVGRECRVPGMFAGLGPALDRHGNTGEDIASCFCYFDKHGAP